MAHVCAMCGKSVSFLSLVARNPIGDGVICGGCQPNMELWIADRARERAEAQGHADAEWAEMLREAEKVIVTTTHHVEGHYVARYLGAESVEYVIGTAIFSELISDISDLFGARSRPFEGKLRKAKQEAMLSLKLLAHRKGANAVMGVDLDYAEFSGNRVALILNGTLVRVKSREPKP